MEQTYIKRETYLQKLIDRMDNGEVKIVTLPKAMWKVVAPQAHLQGLSGLQWCSRKQHHHRFLRHG